MSKRFFALTVLLCCYTSIAQAELVSYWPFEEFPDELSTPDVVSGYDLEVISDSGSFGVDNHVDGKFGKAFEFFSEDTSLLGRTHDEGDLLPINLQPEWTISMWAKVEGTGQNDLRLFSESNTNGNNDPLFNIGTANNGNNGTLDIYIRNAALSTGTVNHPRTNAEPFDGEWSHIGWTFADGMHNIYIDGVYDSSYAMESFGAADPVNIDTTTVGGILRGAPSHWVTGVIDEVAIWNEVLPGNALVGLATEKTTPLEALTFTEEILPALPVLGADVGVLGLSGTVTDIVKGEPTETSGLSQFWFDGNMRGATAVENYLGVGETGNETFPLVAEAFASNTTWWSGNGALTVNGEALPKYPAGLAGTRFDGSDNEENYAVILKGEIFIAEDGEYLVRDGIDDFAMVAIDQDGNGELDDLADILDADAGTLFPGDPIGDVLILDDAWSSVAGGNQTEAEHGIADIQNIDEGGEWRAIQVWMGEAGGGDSGTLYIGNLDDPDIFDELDGAALSQEQIDKFLVPNDRLRTTVAQVESAKATAELRTDVEYVMQVGADGNDQLAVNDADGLYDTTLDVTNATVRVETTGELADGTTITLFDADSIVGADTLKLLFDDASQWDLSGLSSGQITFGIPSGPTCESIAASRLPGDADGDGEVAFLDFLALANNFGTDAGYEGGDFDCDGDVAFLDFLTLANNFGATAAGAASSVPEPSSAWLISLGAMLMGLVRRRRS